MVPSGSSWNPGGIRVEYRVQLGIRVVPGGSEWFRLDPVGHSKVLLLHYDSYNLDISGF